MAMPVTDWERRALIISLQASEAKLTAENKKITDDRNRLLKKMRRQTKEIETMESDWANRYDATDSLTQEVTDKEWEIKEHRHRNQVIQLALNTLVKRAGEWEKEKKVIFDTIQQRAGYEKVNDIHIAVKRLQCEIECVNNYLLALSGHSACPQH